MRRETVESKRNGKPTAVLWIGLAVALATGGIACSDKRPYLVEVEGTVSVKGTPLPDGFITFFPEGNTGSAVSGVIERGHYFLKTSRTRIGVPPGKYIVRMESFVGEATMTGPPVKSRIPHKYAASNTSPLRATVAESPQKQTIDFNIEQ